MSRNLVALTSWNPVGLFRPVMGQLLLIYIEVDCLHMVVTTETCSRNIGNTVRVQFYRMTVWVCVPYCSTMRCLS